MLGEAAMLELTGVKKCFGEGPPVLRGVTLRIARREIVCLLGPSGCGKTTLLRIIAGLEQADAGTVICEGHDLHGVPVHQRNFGLMFQEFALFPHRSVAGNIVFGLRMAGWDKEARDARLADMLDLIGLPPSYAARNIFALSGGERQRVALARSLAPSPRLLMLDEPLGNLDRALRESLMLELRRIIKQVGVTTVYVTHDQEEAYAVGDRIVVMDNGRIVQEGPPQEVYLRPASPFVARFLGFENLLPARADRDGRTWLALGGALRQPSEHLLAPGQAGTLLIHPQAAQLHAHPVVGAFAAVIDEVSFRGDHVQVTVVETPTDAARQDSSELTVRLHFDLPTYAFFDAVRDAPHGFATGTLVYVTINEEMTQIFTDSADDGRQVT